MPLGWVKPESDSRHPDNTTKILLKLSRILVVLRNKICYIRGMKIIIQNIEENVASALRHCGYHFERTVPQTGEISAALDLGEGGFPRFHCYAKMRNLTDLEINLHLDQKRPVYQGTSAHSGEYEGEVVEEEAKRIQEVLVRQTPSSSMRRE